VVDDTAGGGEMGNPNCDASVGLTDLMALRSSYGSNVGECCYRAWADFDMSGSVGLSDLMLLRKTFGTNLGAAPTDAVLCKSKFAPLPACCGKGTCKHVPVSDASCK
jgi:hypothetical protein